MAQEVPDERQVGRDRCRRQAPRLLQVEFVGLHAALGIGHRACGRILEREHAFLTKEIRELPERMPVTIAWSQSLPPISQVTIRVVRRDIGDPDLFLLEPLAETGCQQNLATGRTRRIALRVHPIRELVEPGRQGASPPMWTNKLTVFDMLHSELLSSLKVDRWSPDYVV